MTVLYVILLAVVQGILEFLPVSSFGHLCILQNILGMEHETGVLLEAMLHFGTLAAVILTFWKDISRLLLESLDMLMDTIGNLSLYIHNKRTGDRLRYAKIVSSTYKKFALLLLVSMIPTALLGYTARRLVVLAASSQLLPGAGILITGIVLLVVDLGRMGGKKSCKRRRIRKCHVDWYLSGTVCISRTFQKRTDDQRRSDEWIYTEFCSENILTFCQCRLLSEPWLWSWDSLARLQ